MWPMVMTMLNYPRHIRNKFGNLMLLGIVPTNGTKEPENLNPYTEVAVDKLLELSNSQVYDNYQKALADTCLLSIVLPTHIDYTPKKMFSTTSFAHMKSHDRKQFISQGICLRGLLGNVQRESLFCSIDAVSRIFAEQHDPATLDKLEDNMNFALAVMKRDFPVTLQVYTC